jgi:hypothetical protein
MEPDWSSGDGSICEAAELAVRSPRPGDGGDWLLLADEVLGREAAIRREMAEKVAAMERALAEKDKDWRTLGNAIHGMGPGVAALGARVIELEGALREAEWAEFVITDDGGHRECPVCAARESRGKHNSDCAIGRVLAGSGRAPEPSGG